MKLSVRKSVTAAVLTMAATVGMTVGTVAPASAASCTEIGSTNGSSAKSTFQSVYLNSYTLNMSPNLRVTTSNPCDSLYYRYTAYIYKGDKIYAQKTVNGTTGFFGTVDFGTISVTVPNGTDQMGVGFKTEVRLGTTWYASEKDGWGVYVPGTTWNSTDGTGIVAGGCNSNPDPGASVPRSYNEWCKLPF